MPTVKKILQTMDITIKDIPFCEICPIGKQSRPPFKISSTRASEVLELIHSDLCGPFSVPSLNGKKYFLTFTDDYSRFTHTYFLESKDQNFPAFTKYYTKVTTQHCKNIKALKSDNGGEYSNQRFTEFCENSGINQRCSTPYSPQSNSIAERLNHTLLNITRCFLHGASSNTTTEF